MKCLQMMGFSENDQWSQIQMFMKGFSNPLKNMKILQETNNNVEKALQLAQQEY